MFDKIADFFNSDFGEILLHMAVAIALAFLFKWALPYGFESAFDILLASGFLIRELNQHDWRFTRMPQQSYLEFIIPWIFIFLVYLI
jgi:hypothetical protein